MSNKSNAPRDKILEKSITELRLKELNTIQAPKVTHHGKKVGRPSKDIETLDLTKWSGGVKNNKKGCPPDSFYPTDEDVIAKMLRPLDCLIKKACYVAS